MNIDFWNFIELTLTSSTTWFVFFIVVAAPLLSWRIIRDFSEVLASFDVKLNSKEKKICRKFLNTVFFAVSITFLFFHLYVRLFNA